MNKNMQAVRELSASDRQTRLDELSKELFALRVQRATGQLKTSHQFAQIRKEIARIKTLNNTQKGATHEQ